MPNEFEASEVALDALGRAPSHSMPEAFTSSGDYDADMTRNSESEYLEEKLDGLFLYESTDSGHGASDLDDEKSVTVSGAVGSHGRLLFSRVDVQGCGSQHLTTPRFFKEMCVFDIILLVALT